MQCAPSGISLSFLLPPFLPACHFLPRKSSRGFGRRRGGGSPQPHAPAPLRRRPTAAPMASKDGAAEPPTISPFPAPDNGLGLASASVFSLVYVLAPVYLLSALVLLAVSPFSAAVQVYCVPLLLSAALPSTRMLWLLDTSFLAAMAKYFRYREYLEVSDEELLERMEGRPHILVASPHGVISFGGICSAVTPERNKEVMRHVPTAVASVLLSLPILKHVLGIFGLLDASKASLTKHMKKGGSFVLYVGGIAEMFLSSPTQEALFLAKRKGFIKLALRSNADVVPIYMAGNTQVLRVYKHPVLEELSRRLQLSVTWMWGRFLLPIPLPRKILYLRGRPLDLPHIPEPTDEDVNKWHARFCDEVRRLYEVARKSDMEDYEDKELVMA